MGLFIRHPKELQLATEAPLAYLLHDEEITHRPPNGAPQAAPSDPPAPPS